MFKKILLIILFISSFNLSAFASNWDSLDVKHYRINLDIVYLSQQTISGYTDVKFEATQNGLNHLELMLLQLTVDSVKLNTANLTYSYNDTIIDISLPSTMNSGDSAEVRVYYHGTPQTDVSGFGGFYFTSDSLYAYNIGVGFRADPHNFGRVWFPCVDNFTDRATFETIITTKDSKIAVCGGELLSEVNNGNGTKTYHWSLSDSIPTYLASVAVSDYIVYQDTFISITGDTVPVKLFARQPDSTKIHSAFQYVKIAGHIYENLFGPYVWQRIGYVPVPFNAGAMEHATNIAYPLLLMSFPGYDNIVVHELSHHWFGDLITCDKAEEMWWNEGNASYCEALFFENFSGNQAYKDYIRTVHSGVLRKAHADDGGYWALNGVPHTATYGSIVYKRGSVIMHTLRHYIGSTNYFNALKNYFTNHKFENTNADKFKAFLETETGLSLNDFFNDWIKQPGYAHFSADSFSVTANAGKFDVTVHLRQKNRKTNHPYNSNIIPITFMNNAWEQKDTVITFSGGSTSQTFTINFQPDFVLVDKEETVGDATVDEYLKIKTSGNYGFTESHASMLVSQVSDSAFIQVTENWVKPDTFFAAHPGVYLSTQRSWFVKGVFPSDFKASLSFEYDKTTPPNTSTGYLDDEIFKIQYKEDSLKIVYRKNSGEDWQILNDYTLIPGGNTIDGKGSIQVDSLIPGEYALAMLYNFIGTDKKIANSIDVDIFPNPAKSFVKFEFGISAEYFVQIYSIEGKMIDKFKIANGKKHYKWRTKNLKNGTYLIKISENNKKTSTKKLIISK